MRHLEEFKPGVSEKLGFYVYRLVDPRNVETFYIGKGKGNRVFEHIKETLKLSVEEDNDAILSLKQERIKAIHSENLEVITIIHRHGMDEKTAYEVEAALIDVYPNLSNEIGGHGREYGVMAVEQLNTLYSAEEADLSDFKGSLIIKITEESVIKCNNNIYEAVRKAWKLKQCLLEKNTVPFVFASLAGIIKGVYKVEKWLPYHDEEGRIFFEGTEAPELKRFINQCIPTSYREKGAASPTRYIK